MANPVKYNAKINQNIFIFLSDQKVITPSIMMPLNLASRNV